MKEILFVLWGTEFNAYEESLAVLKIQIYCVLSLLPRERTRVNS